MPDADIERIIEKNKDKLRHPHRHDWEIRKYPALEGTASMGVCYDNTTGDISHPTGDGETKENYSVVVLQYPVGHRAGPWILSRHEDGCVVVTRYDERKAPFGEEPGDTVLEQSVEGVEGFNAQR